MPDWDREDHLKSADALIDRWERLRPAEALQLLDPKFWKTCEARGLTKGDRAKSLSFRDYAVRCMATVCDNDLADYMLEIAGG